MRYWLGKLATVLLVLCIGAGHGNAQPQTDDEARDLRAQEQRLSERVKELRSEQKQLLVRKMLCSSDSKYLEIDLRSGEGTLKYRTRILRTFRFSAKGKLPKPAPEGGLLTLTAKEDGAPAKRRLSFGNAELVIESNAARRRQGRPGLSLSISKRNLAALYYTLEAGSFLYMTAKNR